MAVFSREEVVLNVFFEVYVINYVHVRVIFRIIDEHETLVATLSMWKFRVVTVFVVLERRIRWGDLCSGQLIDVIFLLSLYECLIYDFGALGD